ncbi:baseplate J/gp47 family protein [Anaerovorax odorimutans]|uniref:Baseplate J/gp47 family protein n=1 Tax=Anaerovorax odorimutans TaxID=109327 RepID=A0ABT1RPN6_9FIRM|nr:baseplate J/gp47 family protein [Anaerovorax odorimutans]MCQ4637150.1 baseplate J/gp47 family protein [Anaerovorax odorimutans]
MDEDVILYGQEFESIMERLLANVPEDLDTREGSVIYNALAPAGWEIQLLYEELNLVLTEAFADTCSLDYLIRRAKERLVEYKRGEPAIVKGVFTPADLDVTGIRFVEEESELIFAAIEKLADGEYKLECEESGVIGNLTQGQLIPVDTEEVEDLETAEIVDCLEPGRDDEDVEDFRERYFDNVAGQDFGGNLADYKNKVNSLEHVGGCKIVPVWNGGGTVKVIVLDHTHSVPSDGVVREVQSVMDPIENSGEGKGIAPIGHRVTVAGAEPVNMNITAFVAYAEGYDYALAQASIAAALDAYFEELRIAWGDAPADIGTIVRISQIENRLLNLTEILDIEETAINGSAKNVLLQGQQVPVRGTFNGA